MSIDNVMNKIICCHCAMSSCAFGSSSYRASQVLTVN